MESLLHLGISLVLNLILFTLLSFYLFVKVDISSTPPLPVYLEELPQEEVKFASGKQPATLKAKSGGIVKRGREKVEASPMQVEREKGDVQVPAGASKEEEPSLLQDIEQRIKGKQREISEEGSKGSELGNIVAIVSPSGVGLSGSGRSTTYIPPLPKIDSDEPLSVLKIRIWVEPSGAVSKAQIVQRSGSPQVDQKMLEFVRGIRFEAIRNNTVQTGIITFRFKGG